MAERVLTVWHEHATEIPYLSEEPARIEAHLQAGARAVVHGRGVTLHRRRRRRHLQPTCEAEVVQVGGQARTVDQLDLRTLGVVLEKNGQVVSLGAGAAVLGHPAAAVAMLANHLGRHGQEICVRRRLELLEHVGDRRIGQRRLPSQRFEDRQARNEAGINEPPLHFGGGPGGF